MNQRKCPVCGEDVIGRADKIFCSDPCRTFYNNALERRRRQRNEIHIKQIRRCVAALERSNAKFLLRILALISQVFKILSTFAYSRKRRL